MDTIKRTLVRKSSRFHLQRITAGVALITILLCITLITDYTSPLALSFWKSSECPPIQKISSRDVFGLDPEMKEALACRFEERRKRLNRACTNTRHSGYAKFTRKQTDGRKTLIKANFTVCVLQKVASQFWRHYLKVYKEAMSDDEVEIVTSLILPQNYVMKTMKAAFVRDPYSRLFSGYVDKLFSPNPTFWKMGSRVIRNFRVNGSMHVDALRCGADVTFAEFVEYILTAYDYGKVIDRHFKPIHFRCEFCKMDYHYIGKMETFLEDTVFISEVNGALQHRLIRQYILDKGFNSAIESMYENAYNLFTYRLKAIKKCGLTLHQALKLTWRRWQIRGYIEPKFACPIKRDDNNITFERFYHLAVVAHTSSDNRKLADTKMAALREAYSSLSFETKLRLKEMFLPEFEMFGYDPMPGNIFLPYDRNSFGFMFLEKQTIFDGT